MKVKSVRPYTGPTDVNGLVTVYDLTVADTHTYCAGSVLVSNSKRVSLLDLSALLSHSVPGVIKDAKQIRGQRNEEYWLPYLQGYSPPPPKVPLVYQKFIHELKASGINVIDDGSKTHLMALTDKDVDQLAGNRNLQNAETVDQAHGLKPIPGGMFAPELTGGHSGLRWAALKLAEPMPSPVFEEPIRRLLGLTEQKFRGILAGREQLGLYTGPQAIQKALSAIDVDKEIAQAREHIKGGRKAARDAAVRKLGYLKSAKELDIHPREWILARVPVLPPLFRPISVMSDTRAPLVADPNYLYAELWDANDNLQAMQKEVSDVGEERLAVYDAFKAVTGLGSPVHPKLVEKNVGGFLAKIFGSSPKMGAFQRKLISNTADMVGRGVIVPDRAMNMDSIGIPEGVAWETFKPIVARNLRRRGFPIVRALKEIEDRSKLAKDVLMEEMSKRPVLAVRAPVLHKFGIMAFRPRLVTGHAVRVSPLIVGGYGADFDGDAMQFHVPISDRAVTEAYDRMLPSKNLLSPADFKTPVHGLKNEMTGGLYALSTAKSKRRPHVFATKQDALRAIKAGEVDFGDPVEIMS